MKKLSGGILVLVAIFIAGVWILPRLGLAGSKNNIVVDREMTGLGESFEMTVEELQPFAVFEDGKLVSRESAPEWAMSAIWTIGLDEKLLMERVSPEYLAAYGAPELHLGWPEGASRTVLYGVRVKTKAGEFLIRCNAFGRFDVLPDKRQISAGILKRIQDRWMLYPDFEGLRAIPWNDLPALKAIIASGRATVNDFGSLAPETRPTAQP